MLLGGMDLSYRRLVLLQVRQPTSVLPASIPSGLGKIRKECWTAREQKHFIVQGWVFFFLWGWIPGQCYRFLLWLIHRLISPPIWGGCHDKSSLNSSLDVAFCLWIGGHWRHFPRPLSVISSQTFGAPERGKNNNKAWTSLQTGAPCWLCKQTSRCLPIFAG